MILSKKDCDNSFFKLDDCSSFNNNKDYYSQEKKCNSDFEKTKTDIQSKNQNDYSSTFNLYSHLNKQMHFNLNSNLTDTNTEKNLSINKDLKFQHSTLFSKDLLKKKRKNERNKIHINIISKKTDYLKSCSFCDSKFSSVSAFTKHNKIKHNEINKNNFTREKKCKFNKANKECRKNKNDSLNMNIKTAILTNEQLPILENEETTKNKVPKWSRNLQECLFFIEKSYRCKSQENSIVQSSNLNSFSPMLIRPSEDTENKNYLGKIFILIKKPCKN